MRSMFKYAPFGRQDGGLVALSPVLGQEPPQGAGEPGEPVTVENESLPEFLKGIADSITDLINSLLDKMPPEALGQYQKEFEDCKRSVAQSITNAPCLYSLYQRIKDAAGAQGQISTRPPLPPATPSEFPWVPVALAGGAGLLLIYALTR